MSSSLYAELAKVSGSNHGPAEGTDFGEGVSRILAEAREQYSGIALSDVTFVRYLAELIPESEWDGIESRVTSDLYLACACIAGDRVALSLLNSVVLARLPGALLRLRLDSVAIDEAIQGGRTKLLVGGEGSGKLGNFSGTGRLFGWVKVIAIRDAMRASRKLPREVELSDALQSSLPSNDLDPDLAYQRRLYRAEFKSAFASAVDKLSPRDRSLLRQSIVYQSTVDQIAVLYRVHRATAARWVAKARNDLAAYTRGELRNALKLSESQCSSIVRLVESQMDLSVERLLATAGDDDK